MLTEASYMMAIYAYTGAAALILLCLAWWLGRSWGAGWTLLAVLLSAALLLTPAFPREGVDTMAPALVVAGFQVMTEGLESAMHARRPLAYSSGLALVLAALLRLTLFRRRQSPPES